MKDLLKFLAGVAVGAYVVKQLDKKKRDTVDNNVKPIQGIKQT